MQEGGNGTAHPMDPGLVLADFSVCANETCSATTSRRRLRAWPDHIDHNRADEVPFRVNDAIAHALGKPQDPSAAMAESTRHAVHAISGMRQASGRIADTALPSLGRKVDAGSQARSADADGMMQQEEPLPVQHDEGQSGRQLWPASGAALFQEVRYGNLNLLPPKPAAAPQEPPAPRVPRLHIVHQRKRQREPLPTPPSASPALQELWQASQHTPLHDPLHTLHAAAESLSSSDKQRKATGHFAAGIDWYSNAPAAPQGQSHGVDRYKQHGDVRSASGAYSMYNTRLGSSVSVQSGSQLGGGADPQQVQLQWPQVAAATGFESGISKQRSRLVSNGFIRVLDRRLLDSAPPTWSVPFTPAAVGTASLAMQLVTAMGKQVQLEADVLVTPMPEYVVAAPVAPGPPLAGSSRSAAESDAAHVDTMSATSKPPFRFRTDWLPWLVPAVAGTLVLLALFVTMQLRHNSIRSAAVSPEDSGGSTPVSAPSDLSFVSQPQKPLLT